MAPLPLVCVWPGTKAMELPAEVKHTLHKSTWLWHTFRVDSACEIVTMWFVGLYLAELDLCHWSNGGCSEHAVCTKVSAGERTCTCREGYTGDGVVCLGMSSQTFPRRTRMLNGPIKTGCTFIFLMGKGEFWESENFLQIFQYWNIVRHFWDRGICFIINEESSESTPLLRPSIYSCILYRGST